MTEPTEVRAAEARTYGGDAEWTYTLRSTGAALVLFDTLHPDRKGGRGFLIVERDEQALALIAALLAQVPDGCDVVIRRDGTLMAAEVQPEMWWNDGPDRYVDGVPSGGWTRHGDGWHGAAHPDGKPLYRLRPPSPGKDTP